MNKDPRNLVWKLLPIDFKRKLQNIIKDTFAYNESQRSLIKVLFGDKNLTEDLNEPKLQIGDKAINHWGNNYVVVITKVEKHSYGNVYEYKDIDGRVRRLHENFLEKYPGPEVIEPMKYHTPEMLQVERNVVVKLYSELQEIVDSYNHLSKLSVEDRIEFERAIGKMATFRYLFEDKVFPDD